MGNSNVVQKGGGTNPFIVMILFAGILTGLVTMGRNSSSKQTASTSAGELVSAYMPQK